jgi:hypothetical protein
VFEEMSARTKIQKFGKSLVGLDHALDRVPRYMFSLSRCGDLVLFKI